MLPVLPVATEATSDVLIRNLDGELARPDEIKLRIRALSVERPYPAQRIALLLLAEVVFLGEFLHRRRVISLLNLLSQRKSHRVGWNRDTHRTSRRGHAQAPGLKGTSDSVQECDGSFGT